MRLLHYTILHKKIYLQVFYHTGRVVDPFINPEQLSLFHFSGREKKVTQKKPKRWLIEFALVIGREKVICNETSVVSLLKSQVLIN